jgi:ATP phosphoribosyltransferase
MTTSLIFALPKGRIQKEFIPLLTAAGITPEPEFFNKDTRKLRFVTSRPGLELVVVRSFDAATFVAFGAAQLGVAGSDVIAEFDHAEIYAPVDLNIGHCRLSIAEKIAPDGGTPLETLSHVRIATKYPNLTRRHFAARGIQAECIKLNGAMELAPSLGLCRRIVDLVSTGTTLRANGLREVETILPVSSKLIVNRTALKTRSVEVLGLINQFRQVVGRGAAL